MQLWHIDQSIVTMTPEQMTELGLSYNRQGTKMNGSQYCNNIEMFRRMYGVQPYIACMVWHMLMRKGCFERAFLHPKPHHLLFSLYFLSNYTDEHVAVAHFGVTRKTYRKWHWLFTYAIAGLKRKVVSAYPMRLG